MTYHIFSEPRDGFVAHTAASKYLVNEPTMQDWLGLVTEEMWPAASKVRNMPQQRASATLAVGSLIEQH